MEASGCSVYLAKDESIEQLPCLLNNSTWQDELRASLLATSDRPSREPLVLLVVTNNTTAASAPKSPPSLSSAPVCSPVHVQVRLARCTSKSDETKMHECVPASTAANITIDFGSDCKPTGTFHQLDAVRERASTTYPSLAANGLRLYINDDVDDLQQASRLLTAASWPDEFSASIAKGVVPVIVAVECPKQNVDRAPLQPTMYVSASSADLQAAVASLRELKPKGSGPTAKQPKKPLPSKRGEEGDTPSEEAKEEAAEAAKVSGVKLQKMRTDAEAAKYCDAEGHSLTILSTGRSTAC